jgi:hypothetical protein
MQLPPRSSARACAAIATAAALLAAGCGNADRASQETGNKTKAHGQSGAYLNAVDTETIAQATQQVELVCTQGPKAAGRLEPKLRAAAGVARREPDKLFRAGTSDEARPTIDVMANLAGQLRDCGQAKRASELLSRGRRN